MGRKSAAGRSAKAWSGEASSVGGLTQVKQEGLRRHDFKRASAQRSLEGFDALCGVWSKRNTSSEYSVRGKR